MHKCAKNQSQIFTIDFISIVKWKHQSLQHFQGHLFKSFFPDYHVSKWLLDSAHDAMPYYLYCRANGIQPFIDLNKKRGIKEKYKDDIK